MTSCGISIRRSHSRARDGKPTGTFLTAGRLELFAVKAPKRQM